MNYVFNRKIVLCFAILIAYNGTPPIAYAEGNNLTDPLYYTKLRFQDYGYMEILRNFQKEYPYQEKEIITNYSYIDYYNQSVTKNICYYQSESYESSVLARESAVIEVLDRIYLSKILHYQVYSYDNPDDRKNSGDPKVVSFEKCNADMDLLVSKLKESLQSDQISLVDAAAINFFDTYAADEPGLFLGNVLWLGNWRECNKNHVFTIANKSTPRFHSFHGRHCIASIKNPKWDEAIRNKVQHLLETTDSKPHFKYPEQQYDYARFFKLQIGICLPMSCDSNIIETRRDDIHQLLSKGLNEPYKSYNLSDLFCPPDEASKMREFDLEAWIFIGFASFWLSLILIATIIDYILTKIEAIDRRVSEAPLNTDERFVSVTQNYSSHSHNNQQRLMKFRVTFSFIRNFKKLLSTKAPFKVYKKMRMRLLEEAVGKRVCSGGPISSTLSPLNLEIAQFLNAYKLFAMLTVLFGHCLMVKWDLTKYPLDYARFHTNISWNYDLTAPFAVDWFFFITGLIASYTVFLSKSVHKNTPFQWFYSILRRYWRLAPPYIILFWFMRSIFSHTGSGPLWDYGTYNMTIRSLCRRESWIYPLTLTPNLHPLHEECVMASWYLGNDFQFFLITPFLLISLAKNARIGWILNLNIMFASINFRIYYYLTSNRVKPLDLIRPRADFIMRNNWDNSPTYLYPHYRISSYIVGILTGHYIYMVLSGKWKSFIYPPSLKTNGGSRNSRDTAASQTFELTKKNDKEKPDDKGEASGDSATVEPTIEAEITIQPVDVLEERAKTIRKIVWWTGLFILVSITSISFPLMYFPRSMEPYSRLVAAVFYSLNHTITSLGLALITVTMFFGQYPKVRLFLMHPFFTLMSRFNLILFMIQVELIYFLLQTSEYYTQRSFNDQTMLSMNVFCIGLALSAIIIPIIELPLLNLEKLFTELIFKPKSRTQPKPAPTTQNQQLQEQPVSCSPRLE